MNAIRVNEAPTPEAVAHKMLTESTTSSLSKQFWEDYEADNREDDKRGDGGIFGIEFAAATLLAAAGALAAVIL